MNTESIRCPKCNGEMVQGFIFDREDGGLRRVINWVEGAPEKAFWTVTRVQKEKCVPVGTFVVRCAASWNPMLARNLLLSKTVSRSKIFNKVSSKRSS
jgi:hypothetical protein